jgi:hypothetical protein
VDYIVYNNNNVPSEFLLDNDGVCFCSTEFLSRAIMSDEGERTCPLCAEEMDLTDQQLRPCKCGYQVCSISMFSLLGNNLKVFIWSV